MIAANGANITQRGVAVLDFHPVKTWISLPEKRG